MDESKVLNNNVNTDINEITECAEIKTPGKARDGNRKTGIDIIGDVPWGTHLCQFYKTKEDLLDILIPYFKAGLENNEFCMWVCWDPLRAEEARLALSKIPLNIDDYIKKGQIEIVDYSKRYTVQGNSGFDNMKQFWTEKEKLAFEKGFEGLRFAGNTYWLERNEWKDFVKYEEEVDSIIRGYKMLAICPYSLDKCGASEIIDVIGNHKFAITRREGEWEIIESAERKKAREEIKRAEEGFCTLIQNSSDIIMILETDMSVQYVSPAVERLLGYKPENFIGKNALKYAHPDDIPAVQTKFENIIKQTGTATPIEFRIQHKNGSWVYFEIVANNLLENPNVEAIIVNARDITERKKAEEALRAEKNKLKTYIESMVDGVGVADANGTITQANKALAEMHGYESPDELVGKSIFVLVSKRALLRIKKMYIESVKKKEKVIKNFEIIHRRKDDSEFPITHNITRLWNKKGKMVGEIAVIRDITERRKIEEALRKSEEKYRALTESSADFIFVSDRKGRYLYANPAYAGWLGKKPDDLIGKKPLDFFSKKETREMLKLLKRVFRENKPISTEYTIFLNEKCKHFFVTLSPIRDYKGKVVSVVGMTRDITENKKTERKIKCEKKKTERLFTELNGTHKKLKKAQKQLLGRERIIATGALAAGVAHEIRNPLAIIGMTVQYLQSKLKENDPKRELTEAIIRKVERLDKVTKELSSYGRTMDLNIRKHKLARCLNTNLALIKPKCRLQKIKIKKIYSHLPLIKIDDEQMDKVFLNIMDNAIQSMPHGGILTVSTEFDKGADTAVTKIHNTGPAIKKKHLSHVFEPFYTTRKGRGTGLGLAIVHNVITRHNGQIAVENKTSGKDKGVAFIVSLPVTPPPPQCKVNIEQ